ncbi:MULTISPECIES: hypothetical protein [unclassified Microcoleus]|uniref:hypothetical protein n=1 Tax=unclassified Microcoleus TaxID=2642155 RepID=UPI001DA08E00|nr:MULTISPECIES: hypothetical protein [unclassified Microcoleus]MCC3416542.1 hypothetical protein [Microcoleus sp. PH2017_07_MST_O_A]MCC3466334.1 hypothetical protein [Microcoleus sp. PH2017_06_SFM_O_A]MCC3503772.1 hypothetical protein [Microcoleus sp. PH2017_19_SFW_U_A]MCC3412530.1 hypothetical protein [Microcoleus sp. PH2017_02_FOX_O_A]MCC3427684.1 hypothetical protein [Microcoleus sp. PH2017_01_SCD_O_A]
MNSLILISPDRGSGFKPILSGKLSNNLDRPSIVVCMEFRRRLPTTGLRSQYLVTSQIIFDYSGFFDSVLLHSIYPS